MKKRIAGMITAGIVAASLAGCQSSSQETTAAAEGTSASQSQASETSAEETEGSQDLSGSITLYTSQPEEDIQTLIDGFNQKWPDIQVDVFRSGTEEVVSRVLAENEAGSLLADVLLVADDVTFETLKEQNLLIAYESPELEGIPEEYIDKDHMYTGTKVITTGIAYNTDLVDTAPTSFADLTDPAYKDNLIMPSPLYSGAAAYNLGVITRTEGMGWDYYQALKDNGITVDRGNGAVQNAIVAGDKACGLLADYMAIRSKNDGAPVEFVYPEEGSPAVTEPIGIVNGTDNEELAKAFVDYVLSDDGQTLTSQIGYTPVKSGVAVPEGLRSIDEINLMTWDTQELYQNRDADKDQFTEMFQ